jgi:phytol kinase
MWLDPYFPNKIMQDVVATVITFALSLAWLRLLDGLAQRGWLEQRLSRKIIHIGTGPLFVLCWNLFSAEVWARWAAALVPLAITLQFALVGLGALRDEAAVKAMTRTGDPREILRGPLYYGIVFVICTLLFWRHSPVGLTALMVMCGGDGLADIVGRRWGGPRLPHSPEKSWGGSLAMLGGSFIFGFGMLLVFTAFGNFDPALAPGPTAAQVAAIALAATAVESLPFRDVDNLTITAAAVGLGIGLF